MLTDEQKAEIDKHFRNRNEDFAARQQLMINERVASETRELENVKRARLQFLTAVGGASLIGVALLAWNAISGIVEDKVSDEMKDPLSQLESIRGDINIESQKVAVLTGRVDAALSETDETLRSVRNLLGILETAEGRLALFSINGKLDELKQVNLSLMQINEKLVELENRDLNLVAPPPPPPPPPPGTGSPNKPNETDCKLGGGELSLNC